MKTKMTNTNKIITAYKENEEKFKVINNLSSEIEDTIHKKNQIFTEINKTFQIVFHNFATERIKTGIKIKYGNSKNNTQMVVFINKEGISVRTDSSYSSDGSTTNIFSYQTNVFIAFLKELKEKELEIQQHIKKKEKQDILHNFLEDVDLLEIEIDEEYKKSFNKLHFFDEDEEEIITDELTANARAIEYAKSENYWNNKSFTISPHNTGLRDKLIIEQLFDELKIMLEEYLAKEKQALINSELFLKDIKEKFNTKLIIAELKKKYENQNPIT